MARPRLTEDKKLSRRLIFRLSENELNQLRALAKSSGKRTGTIVRAKLFSGKFPLPKMARVDIQTYFELKKIGVNINQLAKKANANRFPYGIERQLQQLLTQQDIILNLLLNDSESEDR